MFMEATDPGASGGGMVGGAEGQGGSDEPGDPNGPEGHESLGGVGEASAAAAEVPELAQAPHPLGPGRDALPGLGGQALAGPSGHAAPWPGGQAMAGPGDHATLGTRWTCDARASWPCRPGDGRTSWVVAWCKCCIRS